VQNVIDEIISYSFRRQDDVMCSGFLWFVYLCNAVCDPVIKRRG